MNDPGATKTTAASNDTRTDPPLKVVGQRPIRPDGADKVTGRANFGADLHLPGMLTGRIKRSPHAHARILGIDTRAARALPGVKAVVTAADFAAVGSEALEQGEAAATLSHVSLELPGARQGAVRRPRGRGGRGHLARDRRRSACA